jgi:hypothetical protein
MLSLFGLRAQVFVGGEFLGGNSDVFEKYRDGSLESMLRVAEDKDHTPSASPTAKQAYAGDIDSA